jgi:hypothetical protein
VSILSHATLLLSRLLPNVVVHGGRAPVADNALCWRPVRSTWS